MENLRKEKLVRMIQMALLSSICIIMAFTPLGFLKVGLIEITFYTIPVTVAAVMLGPLYGGVLGALFGVLSFIQCFSNPILGMPLLAINPFLTFVICFIPRVLIGVLTGLINGGFKKVNASVTNCISCLICPILNTILFIGALILVFGQTDVVQSFLDYFGTDNFIIFAGLFAGVNALIEIPSCAIISFAILKIFKVVFKNN